MKKRELSIDILRILATIIVLNYHFTALLGTESSFIYKFSNGNWGACGVTVFFLISGFLLKKSACNTCGEIKSFYKKKFLRLFPMLYISFIIAYVIKSIIISNWLWGLAPWRFIFSAMGIDMYLGFYNVPSYAIVGEWFTFAIIIVYLVFPLLNRLMEMHLKTTTFVIAAIYVIDLVFNFSGINRDYTLTNAVMIAWIGMIFFKYKKVIMTKCTMIMALAAGIIILFVNLPITDRLPYAQAEGICIFLFLYIAIDQIMHRKKSPDKLLIFFSNMSYPTYINHHFLLYLISNIILSIFGTWTFKLIILFYIIWLAVTFCWSMGIYYLEKLLMKHIFARRN